MAADCAIQRKNRCMADLYANPLFNRLKPYPQPGIPQTCGQLPLNQKPPANIDSLSRLIKLEVMH